MGAPVLAMPFLVRGRKGTKTSALRRMWPHYWLGYATFLVACMHAWLAMRSGNMAGIDIAGCGSLRSEERI